MSVTRKIQTQAAGKQTDGARFRVTLIQEGMGNFGTRFYYTAEAIKSAADVFEGKKGYYNHPDAMEEEILPERSVQKIFCHYENCKAVEVAGRLELQADCVIPGGEQFDAARLMLQHALEYAKKYPDKDFVGFSINAAGDADETDIDEVAESCPDACKAKLEQAKAEGIETVMVTNKILDGVSVDLVTEAGAGGKVLKMLEAAKEKKGMSKKVAQSKGKKDAGKKKAAKVTEADEGKKAEGKADGDGADAGADHPDADKDKALIKGMLDKHLGDGKHDDKDAECMKQALEAYQGMGHEGEEAEKMAAAHVKAAKAMAAKQAEADEADESEADEAEEKEADESEADEADESEADENADGDEPGPALKKKKHIPVAGEKKESNVATAEIVKLRGENAALKEKLAKIELDQHIESKLAESGLPRSSTKLLRESVGEVKSIKEFDRFLKIFVESRKDALGGEAGGGFEDVFTQPEKQINADDVEGSSISFADAAEEN